MLPSYIIGIDLGTTNCTLAYTSVQSKNQLDQQIEQFEITQIIASQTEGKLFSLPSFLYFPLEEEKKAGGFALEWEKQPFYLTGEFAKNRGSEISSRLIASAKSWLCHQEIDRYAPILPLELEEKELKMSPINVCAQLLIHLRQAWDNKKKETPFCEQTVLITVPASFDPSARQLVQEAAKQAGYPDVILLEEPQAAFYAWLHTHAQEWRQQLKLGDILLVVDSGGGTTDFSLIGVEAEEGDLILKRLAVGSHLLLGGDNMDLALAYLAKQKLEEQGQSIDQWQLHSLIYQSRQAKEKLLGENPPKELDLTVLGRGSRLIGQTLNVKLTQKEVENFILEGFFPFIEPQEGAINERRTGIQQIGLPYAQDPRISAHLANFLSRTPEGETKQNKEKSLEQFVIPTHVLFNGGTLKSATLRQNLLDLLNSWAKKTHKKEVKELQGANYDFAVSQGAVYYGLARQGKALRIRGGTSHSYFIGVEESAPAVPGIHPPLRAVCLVPFGMEEGEERELHDQVFALRIGELATFRFFSYSNSHLPDGVEPLSGTVLIKWKQQLKELSPIEAQLDRMDEESKIIHVKLKAKVTELGVLELWCVAANGRQWKLEFDTRKT